MEQDTPKTVICMDAISGTIRAGAMLQEDRLIRYRYSTFGYGP